MDKRGEMMGGYTPQPHYLDNSQLQIHTLSCCWFMTAIIVDTLYLVSHTPGFIHWGCDQDYSYMNWSQE